jgi:hypothetical protein
LATDGELGDYPDWYLIIQAAKYLGVPPWELMKQSVFWRNAALKCMQAEYSARKTIEARQNNK